MTTTRLSSWLLLAGILAGFLGATWHGHLAARYSKPDNFRRFHQRISPDALFYPPYAMLENLALARWEPGKVLVIIGGNSILNGVGQPENVVWSRRLQDLLGVRYVVVNLAFRSAYPAQAGAVVAEALQRRGLPVVYVTNTNPTAGPGLAPGAPLGYFYWQAWHQERLAPYAPREAAIARWLAGLSPREHEAVAEERLGASLEALSRHQSLWHHIGYRHFFTVWNSLVAENFLKARARLPDNEPPARPLAERFNNQPEAELAIVRGYSYGRAAPDATGRWHLNPASRAGLGAEIEAAFRPELRPHMLVLLDENAPVYLARLTPEERARNDAVYAGCVEVWTGHGIACAVTGDGFAPDDYIDRSHLSASGGAKLAEQVAAKVRRLQPPLSP